jgi:enoyl-CoA hydratase
MDESYARYTRLRVERPHPRVLRVSINRANKYNAADAEMHANMAEIWRNVDADASVNAVLLTGTGRAFSAGGDLTMIEEMHHDFDTRARVWREARDMVYNCRKPIVSAINGVAVGAGLVLAILADVSIAAKSARLIDGHTKLGVAAGRSRCDHLAAVMRHGESQVSPASLRTPIRRRSGAHRAGFALGAG